MQSDTQTFTPEQLEKFRRGVDQIYLDFTAKVAVGRKMAVEKVREVAKGRVWTGADAKQRGLVDEFGGFRAALEATKALAGIPADSEINLERFPKRRSPFEEVAEMFGTTAEVVQTVSLLGKIMGTEPVAGMTKLLTDETRQTGTQLRLPEQKTR
jgi:protease-4